MSHRPGAAAVASAIEDFKVHKTRLTCRPSQEGVRERERERERERLTLVRSPGERKRERHEDSGDQGALARGAVLLWLCGRRDTSWE